MFVFGYTFYIFCDILLIRYCGSGSGEGVGKKRMNEEVLQIVKIGE